MYVTDKYYVYLDKGTQLNNVLGREKWSRLGSMLTHESVSAWKIEGVQYLTTQNLYISSPEVFILKLHFKMLELSFHI